MNNPSPFRFKAASYWSHTFLPGLVKEGGLVFDFGVNSGGFSRLLAPRCRRIIGFEPDPYWGEDRLVLPDNVELHRKAIAAERGKLVLNVNEETCSSLHYADRNAATVEVEAVTLADALALAPEGRIDLIKMDIEGEEVPILLKADAALFTRVAQMTIEFHDFLDPKSLPSIFQVIARLRELGFTAYRMSWRSYGDMVFINEKLEPMTAWQRFNLGVVHKYAEGMKRIFGRIFRRPKPNK